MKISIPFHSADMKSYIITPTLLSSVDCFRANGVDDGRIRRCPHGWAWGGPSALLRFPKTRAKPYGIPTVNRSDRKQTNRTFCPQKLLMAGMMSPRFFWFRRTEHENPRRKPDTFPTPTVFRSVSISALRTPHRKTEHGSPLPPSAAFLNP